MGEEDHRGMDGGGARPLRALERKLAVAGSGVNLVGAVLVAVYLLFVFPPEGLPGWMTLPAAVFALVYWAGAAVLCTRHSRRHFRRATGWLREGREPTSDEQRRLLRSPKVTGGVSLKAWLVAAPVAGGLALPWSPGAACEIAVTLVLSGLTVAASAYLLEERLLRSLLGRALETGSAPEARSLGIGPRLLLTWLLCTGVPIVMLASVPLGREVTDPDELVAPIWFTAAVALGAGFIAMKLSTHAVARPIQRLRRAVDAVAEGDLDHRVPVDDASEVGRLQAGFNAMVEGLRERERIRDLFGRHAGIQVAREALEHGTRLGGHARVVSVLFVDVVGSTALAATQRPERVVELLNGFFAEVVAAVERHGGFVNKFEGDAALCVFGAPVAQPDHAARALAAGRELRYRLDRLDGGVEAAIGISCGEAVAGWVGAESRLEYTVIGDPVNEAHRITELAKHRTPRLLASRSVVDAAGAAGWTEAGDVVLRGRTAVTRLSAPAEVQLVPPAPQGAAA